MALVGRGLAKLIEECGELQQIAGKKLAFYYTDVHPDGAGSMATRLEDEMADVLAAIWVTIRSMELDGERVQIRAQAKYETFLRWHGDSQRGHDGIDRNG